jgi:hypothetical protein
MPGKMARSAPRPSFGLPELLVAIHISRQSCCKAGKARIFTQVRESSEESWLIGVGFRMPGRIHMDRCVVTDAADKEAPGDSTASRQSPGRLVRSRFPAPK